MFPWKISVPLRGQVLSNSSGSTSFGDVIEAHQQTSCSWMAGTWARSSTDYIPVPWPPFDSPAIRVNFPPTRNQSVRSIYCIRTSTSWAVTNNPLNVSTQYFLFPHPLADDPGSYHFSDPTTRRRGKGSVWLTNLMRVVEIVRGWLQLRKGELTIC